MKEAVLECWVDLEGAHLAGKTPKQLVSWMPHPVVVGCL